MAVEDEGAVSGVDANCHRAVLEQRHLEGFAVAGRDVGVALDARNQLGLVYVTQSVLSRVRDGRQDVSLLG